MSESPVVQKLQSECKNTVQNLFRKKELDLKVEDIQLFGAFKHIHLVFVKDSGYNVGWVLDNQCTNCMRCNKSFSLFSRRHHCRVCGFLICKQCGDHTTAVPALKSKSSRVCKECHKK